MVFTGFERKVPDPQGLFRVQGGPPLPEGQGFLGRRVWDVLSDSKMLLGQAFHSDDDFFHTQS